MRRFSMVVVGLAALTLGGGGADAGAFTGKPPLIGGIDVTPSAVAFDTLGNRYVTGGAFLSTADFDPGKGVQTRPDFGQGGKVFVTKFDATGKWLWTQIFGGTGAGGALGNAQSDAIAFANDTVFVVGSFDTNDAGFGGPGTISSHHDNANYGSGYVFALDAATGNPRTTFNTTGVQIFGSSGGGSAHAHAVAITGSKLYVGGSFGALSFGVGGTGTANSTQNDGFVAELDANTGAAVPVFSGDSIQTFAGNGNEEVRSLVVNGAFLYVGGSMGSTNFGIGGVGTVSSGAQFDVDAFVALINGNTGAKISTFGGDGIVTIGAAGTAEEGQDLALANGTLYLAGQAGGSPKIDGAGAVHPTNGGRDVFVLALDALTGAERTGFGAGGVQYFGSPQDDLGFGVGGLAANATGVYVTGSLGAPFGTASIGGGAANASGDAFVVALDPATGQALTTFGGIGLRTFAGNGSQTYDLVDSPDGLAIVGQVPAPANYSGTAFPGAGGILLFIDPASGDPLNMGANRRPVFTAPPIASPNPVVAGKPTVLKAFATDPDGDKVSFVWSFGDAGQSTAASPKKVYAAPGDFGVLCTAKDGKGGSTDSQVLTVHVVAAGTPYFDVAKTTVALKFTAGGDSITVSGQIPLVDGTALLGKTFSIDVGGVAAGPFTLDAKGKSPKGAATVAVTAPKGGVAKFTAKLTKGTYAPSLADEGMTAAKVANRYAPTVVIVTFDGVVNAETMPLLYTSKNGKTGAAK